MMMVDNPTDGPGGQKPPPPPPPPSGGRAEMPKPRKVKKSK